MVGCKRQKCWYVLFENVLCVTREETEVMYVLLEDLHKYKYFFVVKKKKIKSKKNNFLEVQCAMC